MDIDNIYEKILKPNNAKFFLKHPLVKEINSGWMPEENEESDLLKVAKLESKFKKIFFDKKMQLSALYDTLIDIAYYSPDNPISDLLRSAAQYTTKRFKGKSLAISTDAINSSVELTRLAEKLYKQISNKLSYSDNLVYSILQQYININHLEPEVFLAIALGAKSAYSKFLLADSIEDWSEKDLEQIIKAAPADQYAILVYNTLFIGRDSITDYIQDDAYYLEEDVNS